MPRKKEELYRLLTEGERDYINLLLVRPTLVVLATRVGAKEGTLSMALREREPSRLSESMIQSLMTLQRSDFPKMRLRKATGGRAFGR